MQKHAVLDVAKTTSRGSVNLIAIAFLCGVLYLGESVIVTLVFSLFFFILLDPCVHRLAEYRIKRKYGAPILVLLSLILLGLIGFSFYNSILKLTAQMPAYSEKILSLTAGPRDTLHHFMNSTNAIIQGPVPVDQAPAPISEPSSVNGFAWKGFNSVISLLSFLIFIPLLTLFMLLEKDFLHARLTDVFSDHAVFEKSCFEAKEMARGFFVGNFVVGFFMSLIFACVFTTIHLKNPFPLALFAGFLNLIPIFGTILGAVLPCVQAFMQFDDWNGIIIICITSIGMHFIGNNIVMPRFIGSRINVNTTAALLGFLIWGSLWGGVGLFLATPLMALIRILLLTREETRPYANLIGKTPVTATKRIYILNAFKTHLSPVEKR